MKSRTSFAVRLFALGLASLSGAALLSAQQYSHARVVRLSFVEGTVTVQRPDVSELAKAPANTPIQEGFKLSTGENSYAEVEFENAFSTARLGQLSTIEFTQLALAPSGAKINRLAFGEGYATFHFVREAGDIYEVKVGETTLMPSGKSEFRADLQNGELRVEVFNGSVDVSGPAGSQSLSKNSVLDLHIGTDAHYQIAEGITKDAWDQWVANRDKQQSASQGASPGPYAAQTGSGFYGWNDLNSYGRWGFIPGHGYGWFPSVSWGWSPYSLGQWASYPGFGNTWISYEPWGWVPYHYGNWSFNPAFGWFWMPGGFGAWSPALVNWYQGPGWIGWAPQSTAQAGSAAGGTQGLKPGQQGCSPGRTCMTAVPTRLFQSGGVVTPRNNVEVNLTQAQGVRVATPGVTPPRAALLPGVPAAQSAAFLSAGTGVHGTIPAGAATPAAGQHSFMRAAPTSTRASEVQNIRNAIANTAMANRRNAASLANTPTAAPDARLQGMSRWHNVPSPPKPANSGSIRSTGSFPAGASARNAGGTARSSAGSVPSAGSPRSSGGFSGRSAGLGAARSAGTSAGAGSRGGGTRR
jgi:hypothetical protein